MKVTYPLSLKVSLWLLLNLLLLAAAGVSFYWTQFGRGWESLGSQALGDRLAAVGDNIMSDMHSVAATDRDAVLALRGERLGVELYLFLNEGRQIAGKPVTLPPPLAQAMERGPRRGMRPSDLRPSSERGPGTFRSASRPMPEGRMLARTENPTETWIGLRVPVLRENGPPSPGALIIRAPTLLSILRLLDVMPWFWMAVAAFGLSVVFWLPLVGGITRALGRLTQATEAIAEGRFDTRVPDTRRDEIGHLGQSVNRMAARLDTLVSGQKRFLGDVAHELGSPLGRLQVATEILEIRAGPDLQENVNDVREEVQHMALLVNELLAFTQAGLRPRDAELGAVDVDSLITEVLQREDPNGRVHVDAVNGLTVRADRALLGRALGNLIRNALRYAGDTATISVHRRIEPGRIRLSVTDDGPGVPPEALARLGEPFYRPEIARTRESGGVGLGLAIVRSSVLACGGEVHFSNRTPHGFGAEIQLATA
jgi:two-component system sensor histidine kinase CpxA